MRYTGIQPQYFPRLHYFARIINTDLFVLRDEAQFLVKHKYPDGKTGYSYQAHTPIKQANGIFYLRVPISHNGLQPINTTKIAYSEPWAQNQLQTIAYVHKNSANFRAVFPEIKKILEHKYASIAALNIATILWGLMYLLGEQSTDTKKLAIEHVKEKIVKRGEFRLKNILLGSTINSFKNTGIDKNQKIVNALKEVGATEDYCGETAFDAYMDKALFEKNGLTITTQNWQCRAYPQLFTKQQGFTPNLSIIDLLMNASTKEAMAVLKGGS